MTIFSKIAEYIRQVISNTFDTIWDYFFGKDQHNNNGEFEADILFDKHPEVVFIPDSTEVNQQDESFAFEIVSNSDI